jgi:hypothetical protein
LVPPWNARAVSREFTSEPNHNEADEAHPPHVCPADDFCHRTAAGGGQRFCAYIHHTDAEREFAYDRQSNIGKLDKGLDEAKAKEWTVVSMKDDWKTIFPAR